MDCSQVDSTSPRSSQHFSSSGSLLLVSSLGSLHLTKNGQLITVDKDTSSNNLAITSLIFKNETMLSIVMQIDVLQHLVAGIDIVTCTWAKLTSQDMKRQVRQINFFTFLNFLTISSCNHCDLHLFWHNKNSLYGVTLIKISWGYYKINNQMKQ